MSFYTRFSRFLFLPIVAKVLYYVIFLVFGQKTKSMRQKSNSVRAIHINFAAFKIETIIYYSHFINLIINLKLYAHEKNLHDAVRTGAHDVGRL